MPRPTGSQFVTLYRGLHGVTPKDVDTRTVGPHWTTDSGTAVRFAMGESDYGGYQDEPDIDEKIHGVVLTAKVHPRNIMSNDSDEAQMMGVVGNLENENFLRNRAPVHIERMHHIVRTEMGGGESEEYTREINLPKRLRGRA